MKMLRWLPLMLSLLPIAGFAADHEKPIPYDHTSLELLNAVALCPAEYAELRQLGRIREATHAQGNTAEGKLVLRYQISAAVGGGWMGPPAHVTGTLVITRTSGYRPGELMDMPMPFETTCKLTKL